MKLNIPIPKELAHLKIDERGYPIPFFAPIIDGKPNFKYQDERKRDWCIEKKACHICGKKLDAKFCYFISGPIGYKNRVSSDAGMHQVCAEFSLKACPHMFYQNAERKEAPTTRSHIIQEKPPFLLLIKASKFKGYFDPRVGSNIIKYWPVSTRKFVYVEGRLEEDISSK